MNQVFILQHVYQVDDIDEVKLIGVFSSIEKVDEIIDELIKKPGFKSLPRDCFVTSKLKIDEYSWRDGFISWDEANESE